MTGTIGDARERTAEPDAPLYTEAQVQARINSVLEGVACRFEAYAPVEAFYRAWGAAMVREARRSWPHRSRCHTWSSVVWNR